MTTTELVGRLRVAAVLAVLLPAGAAQAQQATTDPAEAMFQRARELMGQGDFATACPMLERTYALDHGAGTLLALALCHEGSGKPATALGEYRVSLSLAVQANRPDRVMLAESHVQQLEAAVPRLTLRFASTPPPALTLALDGAPVERATMTSGAPVDPGRHEVLVTTPTATPWRATVDVPAGPGAVAIDVPALASLAAPRDRAPTSTGSRTLGWTTGGFGVVAAAVGAAFGVAAFEAEARSRQECAGNQCPQDGVSLNHQARLDGLLSDVSFAVGGAALAAGLFLLLRSSPARPTPPGTAWLRAWAGSGRAGVGAAASW